MKKESYEIEYGQFGHIVITQDCGEVMTVILHPDQVAEFCEDLQNVAGGESDKIELSR